MSRTKKKPYRKAKAIDKTCRCHGGCPWCLGNRMHKTTKRIQKCRDDIKESTP
jgi:hypothetical protein